MQAAAGLRQDGAARQAAVLLPPGHLLWDHRAGTASTPPSLCAPHQQGPRLCAAVIDQTCLEQVSKALEAAEPFKEELLRRGVFLVPIPVVGLGSGDEPLAPLDKDEDGANRHAVLADLITAVGLAHYHVYNIHRVALLRAGGKGARCG